jgi:hypothetical protein
MTDKLLINILTLHINLLILGVDNFASLKISSYRYFLVLSIYTLWHSNILIYLFIKTYQSIFNHIKQTAYDEIEASIYKQL